MRDGLARCDARFLEEVVEITTISYKGAIQFKLGFDGNILAALVAIQEAPAGGALQGGVGFVGLDGGEEHLIFLSELFHVV